MRDISLVGAVHGVSVRGFVYAETLEVRPPEDIAERIPAFADAETVAIEQTFESDQPTSELTQEKYFNMDVTGTFLFRALAEQVRGRGAEVQEIDDRHFVRTLLPDLNWRAHTIRVSAEYRGWYSKRQQRAADYMTALFHHININVREDHMFDQIANGNSEVVIMGQAHADRLAVDKELQAKLGVNVAEYHWITPRMPYDMSRVNPYYTPFVDSIIEQPGMDEVSDRARTHAIERTLAQRKFNAFALGRVLGKRQPEPDTLGRFYITSPAASSLFKLHITDRSGSDFTGTVYDVHGDASVQGSQTKDGFRFVKTYDPQTVISNDYVPLDYWTTEFDEDTKCHKGRWKASGDPTPFPFQFVATQYDKQALARLEANDG